MQSAGLRKRASAEPARQTQHLDNEKMASQPSVLDGTSTPRRFTIDLSRPPGERYVEVAQAFTDEIKTLPSLFDVILKEAHLPPRITKHVARACLRRLHNTEETAELRGISRITGIEMYLLVSYNVLLDLFMGCTSGGVRIQEPDQTLRMVHFRTLDWGMDPLRKVIVQLDYVEKAGGPSILSSITYAGYVGILTAVKPGLSVSLNFRPCHDKSTQLANIRFYMHHALVLLGFRASISSLLRHLMLASNSACLTKTDILSLQREFPKVTTTAAYIVFCDGQQTAVFEKDRITAEVLTSGDFVVATNHDVKDEHAENNKKPSATETPSTARHIAGMELLVDESIERKRAICNMRASKGQKSEDKAGAGPKTSLGSTQIKDVIDWVGTPPIKNEETHFATIMDPTAGSILWTTCYPQVAMPS